MGVGARGDRELPEPPVQLVVQGTVSGSGSTRTVGCGHGVCSVAAPTAIAASSAAPTPARARTFAHVLRQPGDVADDPRPQGAATPPPPLRRAAMVAPASRIVSRLCAHGEGGGLHERTEEVPAPVRGRQAEHRAAQVGVEQRRALAGEVGQREQAAGAGPDRGGLVVELS